MMKTSFFLFASLLMYGSFHSLIIEAAPCSLNSCFSRHNMATIRKQHFKKDIKTELRTLISNLNPLLRDKSTDCSGKSINQDMFKCMSDINLVQWSVEYFKMAEGMFLQLLKAHIIEVSKSMNSAVSKFMTFLRLTVIASMEAMLKQNTAKCGKVPTLKLYQEDYFDVLDISLLKKPACLIKNTLANQLYVFLDGFKMVLYVLESVFDQRVELSRFSNNDRKKVISYNK